MRPSKQRTLQALNNPHLWYLVSMMVALTLIYLNWPWLNIDILYPLAVMELQYRIVGILFIIPFAYAVVFFRWRGALAAWVIYMIVILVRLSQVNFTLNAYLLNMIFWLLPLALVAFVTFEIKWRKNMIQREAERRHYSSQILNAQEMERRRISRELHDDTIQKLLAVCNRAQVMLSDLPKQVVSATVEDVNWIKNTIFGVTTDLRRLSINLRPSVLDNMGLVPALIWMVDRINTENNIAANIFINGTEREVSSEAKITIFRIVQEALSNIIRHSAATKTDVTLTFWPKSVTIEIQDNGNGFLVPKKLDSFTGENKLGLAGMRERINLLDGSLAINSKPGEGTSLRIRVKC